jgi:hypothetical protein
MAVHLDEEVEWLFELSNDGQSGITRWNWRMNWQEQVEHGDMYGYPRPHTRASTKPHPARLCTRPTSQAWIRMLVCYFLFPQAMHLSLAI